MQFTLIIGLGYSMGLLNLLTVWMETGFSGLDFALMGLGLVGSGLLELTAWFSSVSRRKQLIVVW